jgi:acetyl esterase/lipase
VPAILYIHGGGWYSGDKADGAYQDFIDKLAQRGFLVAAVNYRLAPRYKFPSQIEDVKAAIRFIKSNASAYGLDPACIGVMGESAGGQLSSLLGLSESYYGYSGSSGLSDESASVKAVVDLFGPTDLSAFFQRDLTGLIDHVFGTYDAESETIKKASPVTYVSSSAPPFLIIQGKADEVVLPEQSVELYRKLVAAGDPANLILVSNAGH